VASVSGTVTGMNTALLVMEAVGIAAMLHLLAAARLPRARVLIYAWKPRTAWAVASGGYVDG
jgi:hypothetical protein